MEPSLADLAVASPVDFPAVGGQTWAAEHPTGTSVTLYWPCRAVSGVWKGTMNTAPKAVC